MKYHVIQPVLLALAALLVASPTVLAQGSDETDEIRLILEEYIGRTMVAPATLQRCLGLTNAETCEAAEIAGFGLKCPDTNTVDDEPHSCTVKTSEEIQASIMAFAKKVLGLSGKFTTEFREVSSESSVDHYHQVCADKAATCRERYVKRHEKISAYIAMYQEGSVTVSPPKKLGEIAAYEVAVNAAKGKMVLVDNRHFCKWVDHGDPRACEKRPEGPITPGGTTEGSGEPGGGDTGGDGDGDTSTECEPASVPTEN